MRNLWNRSNLRRAYLYLQKNGLKDTWYAAAERIHDKRRETYIPVTLSRTEIEEQKKQAEKLKQESSVCFSILVPAYETGRPYLEALLASVAAQTYPYWELVLADAGQSGTVAETVEAFCRRNPRYRKQICYVKLDGNQGISANSNAALPLLNGNYTGLLDHDDTLSPDALYEMARAVRNAREKGSEAILLYSDEDKMNGEGSCYYEPHYKHKFNFDLILSNNYMCHFLVIRTDVLKMLQFRSLYDGAQDYDLILRCIGEAERRKSRGIPVKILHVDRILYHWRCHSGSTADNPASKMYAYEAGRKAVSDFCAGRGLKVFLHHTKHLGFYRVEYRRDIFRQRSDLGAVGGRILRNGKIYAGAFRTDGRILYEGMNSHFSGYMHRAVLQQDVDAVDLRCIRLRPELLGLLREALQEILQDGREGCGTTEADRTGVKENTAANDGRDLWGILENAADGSPDAVSDTILAAWKTGLLSEEQIRGCSLTLCRKVREAGYRILWDPSMETVLSR